jgi:RNA polymerase sigma-70 factor (ECF subfamily)
MMKTMTHGDQDLVPGLRAHEEAAVSALLERYWERSYRAARAIVNDPAGAEDVAQETFLRALRAMESFDSTRPLRPWLFGILELTAREHLRSSRRRSRHEARAPEKRPPERQLHEEAASDEALLVREHLGALPEKLRTALTLRYVEGMELSDVARALDCPEGTVSSRIRRGLESLRASLAPALGTAALALLVEKAGIGKAPRAPAAWTLVARAKEAGPTPDPRAPSALSKATRVLSGTGAKAIAIAVLAVGAGAFFLVPRSEAPVTAEPRHEIAVVDSAPREEHAAKGAPAETMSVKSDIAVAAPARKLRRVTGSVSVAGIPFTQGVAQLIRNGDTNLEPEGGRRTASLDAQGHFTIDDLDPTAERWDFELYFGESHQMLLFSAGDGIAWVGTRAMPQQETTHLEIDLLPAKASGVVKDRATKQPLAHARVELYDQESTADAAGRFRMTVAYVPSMQFPHVIADAPGYASAAGLHEVDLDIWKPTPFEMKDLEIELDPGVSVAGHIVDERGAPLEGAHVNFQASVPTQGWEGLTGIGHGWGARTAADGSFKVVGLVPSPEHSGKALVDLRAWRDARSPKEIVKKGVLVGGEPLEIVVPRFVTWSGRVLSGGKGLKGAVVSPLGNRTPSPGRFGLLNENFERVRVMDNVLPTQLFGGAFDHGGSSNTSQEDLQIARTGKDGSFTLTDVPVGNQLVAVSAPGYQERIVTVGVPDEATFELEPAKKIEGHVRVAGAPIPNTLVLAYPRGTFDALATKKVLVEKQGELAFEAADAYQALNEGGANPLAGAVTDAEGRFELDHLPEGSYDVLANTVYTRFYSHEEAPVAEPIMAVRDAGSPCEIDFEKRQATTVRLKVLAAEDGKPLRWAMVTAVDASGSAGWARSKEGGACTVQSTAKGDAHIVVSDSERAPVVLAFTPHEGDTIDLGEVRVAKGGARLEVHVQLPHDSFTTVAVFVKSLETGIVERRDPTPREPKIELSGLAPGRFEVRAYVVRGHFPDQKLVPVDPVALEVTDQASLDLDLSAR